MANLESRVVKLETEFMNMDDRKSEILEELKGMRTIQTFQIIGILMTILLTLR